MLRLVRATIVLGLMGALTSCGPAPQKAPAEEAATRSVANTTAGAVRGFVEDGVLVFKGVRYGADTATTRFAAPKPSEPWTGAVDALEYGASAMQVPFTPGMLGGLFDSWGTDPTPPFSEDCLFLNVWTPALADGGKRPVMVWFHGGGLKQGSGSRNAYDGVRLANRGDVVIVTVNHRLNVFGYTYLGEFGAQFADSGNAGILDMVLALEWVRDNAAEFGGDPGNVTIFGESGGGVKVTTLMAMEAAEGLFHRVIVQSGPGLKLAEKDAAAAGGAALVEALGLSTKTVDEILTKPAVDILAAYQEVSASDTQFANRAVLDGTHFTRHPFVPDATPRAVSIPMMIGTTRTEASLFIGARDPSTFDLTWEQLPAALAASLDRPDVDVEEIIAGYRRIRPEYSPTDLLFTAATDAGFTSRSYDQANRKAEQGGAPTYFYMLNWNTPVDGGKWQSPHALDIGMVFDNVAKAESMSGIGDEQQLIADMMSEAWLAFARTGNPNNHLLPEWPAYQTDARMVMVFDLEPSVQEDPHGEQRRLFLGNHPDRPGRVHKGN